MCISHATNNLFTVVPTPAMNRRRDNRIVVVDDYGRPIPGENDTDEDADQRRRDREAEQYAQRTRKRRRLQRPGDRDDNDGGGRDQDDNENNDDDDFGDDGDGGRPSGSGHDSIHVRVPSISIGGVRASVESSSSSSQQQRPMLDGPMYRGPPDYDWMKRLPREDIEEDGNPWCFLCEYGQQAHELEKNPSYMHLRNYIDDNFNDVNPALLCSVVQKFYNEKLRPLLAPDRAKDWHEQTIYEHITAHRYDEYISLRKDLRDVGQMMQCLLHSNIYLLLPDDNGGTRFGLKDTSVMLYVKLLEKKMQVQNALRRIGSTGGGGGAGGQRGTRTRIF
jgi:hypothetical protein